MKVKQKFIDPVIKKKQKILKIYNFQKMDFHYHLLLK